eukprot:SAG11_NODE_58_length_19205_cov_30.697315_6_plen_89_part_00
MWPHRNCLGHNWLKPEIAKYWSLCDVLKPETARRILYSNAEEIWFQGWGVPDAETDGAAFAQIPRAYRCETLHMNEGKFVHNVGDERY